MKRLLLLVCVLSGLTAAPVLAQTNTPDDLVQSVLSGDWRLKPANPRAVAPTDGATNVSTATALKWIAFGAAQADVYLAAYVGTACTPVKVATVQAATYQPTAALKPQTKYCWKVVPANGAGYTNPSAAWTFTTGDVAAPPPPPPAELVLTCPAPISAESPDGNPVVVTYAAATTGGTQPVSAPGTPASGSAFPVGSTAVTVVATSADGQTKTCTFTQTVVNSAPPPAPPTSGSVVTVLGDSIAGGSGVQRDTQAFPALLQQKITAANLSYVISNQGKGGRQTSEGLLVIDGLLTSNTRVLVLELGGGDGRSGVPIATIKANLATMIEKAQAKGVSVLLLGILLADPSTATQYQKDFAAIYPALGTQYSVPVVPNMYAGFVAGDVQLDGYHPSISGHVKIADTVWALLQPLLTAVAPSSLANAYYTALCGRTDTWKCYSFRDDAQLRKYAQTPTGAMQITYDKTRDAAKIVIPTVPAGQPVPTGVNSIKNQVRPPLGTLPGHTYFFAWDAWYGKEMSYSLNNAGNASVSGWKQYQFTAPRSPGGRDAIYFEINLQVNLAPTDMGLARVRYYNTSSTPVGPNFAPYVELTPLHGPYANANVVIKAETWTRYFVLLEQPVNDFARISLWVADETRDAAKVLDRIQVTLIDGFVKFYLESNTSTEGLFDTATKAMIPVGGIATKTVRPAQTAYVRNFASLRDTANPTAFLQKPVR